eukprot:symbB.v1.2.023963.t1/scaffold2235.1/size84994/2
MAVVRFSDRPPSEHEPPREPSEEDFFEKYLRRFQDPPSFAELASQGQGCVDRDVDPNTALAMVRVAQIAFLYFLRISFLFTVWARAEDVQADTLAEMAKEPYWHLGYEYSLHRTTMPRSGEGDLWINYENDPKITLQGVAQSPKFGKGKITIVLDSAIKTMYVRIELEKLHRDQCLKYPFPPGTDEAEQKRLKTLRVRQEKIQKVVHETEADWETGKDTHLLPWTDRYRLGIVTKRDSSKPMGVTLRQGKRVVKRVDFIEREVANNQPSSEFTDIFDPPSPSCLSPSV